MMLSREATIWLYTVSHIATLTSSLFTSDWPHKAAKKEPNPTTSKNLNQVG